MAADRALTLRPLGVGDLLDELFALYRRGFKTFVGIAALVHVPLVALAALLAAVFASYGQQLGSGDVNPSAGLLVLGGWPVQLIGGFLTVIGTILELAATCYATSALYLGRVLGVGDAYRLVLDRFGALARLSLPLAGLLVAFLLIVTVSAVAFATIVLFALFASASQPGGNRGGDLLPLLCIIPPVGFVVTLPLIYLAVRWSLAIPALVLEGHVSAVDALRRIRALVRDAWWRTFLRLFVLLLLLFILQSVALGLIGAIIGGIQTAVGPGGVGSLVWMAVMNALLSGAVNAVFVPLLFVGIVLLYYDRRVRVERYDSTVMARELAFPETGEER